MNPTISNSAQLQLRSMRQALENAGRSTLAAQDIAMRALADLQLERKRVALMIEALDQANQRVSDAEAENRRLRTLIGGMTAKNDTITRGLRDLVDDVRTSPAVTAIPSTPRIQLPYRSVAA